MANVGQCPASVQIDGINWCCMRDDGHEPPHKTAHMGTFTDDESWARVFERQQAEQRRINAEIASRPGQEMTRS